MLFHKPFGVLCQFTDRTGARPTLADFIPIRDVYAAGRLDFDSEGLVLLTDDGGLQARIAEPRHKLRKRYVVQVSGTMTDQALARLGEGVELNDGPARALSAARSPALLWTREPPVRHPHATSWVALEIAEGRNRQVRRMLAAVGFPVLRLVRTHVGPWSIDAIAPGRYVVTTVHSPSADNPRTQTSNLNRSPASKRGLPGDRSRSTRSKPPSRRPGAPSSRTRRRS